MPEVRKETEVNGGHRDDRTLNQTRSLFDQTRPVIVQHLRVFLFLIGHGGASGHCRSDVSGRSGSLLDPTGRWHCGVRSVLQRVRSLFYYALHRLDQRVRSVTGPARLVDPSAFGLRVKRVRSLLRS
jgi:hypothetical protein